MLRKKLTFKYDKLKKTNRFFSFFMKTRLNLISVKYVCTYKKNYCVSLNDKDKLDKWTKYQGVSEYGG